jgi:mannonate dehydratase
MQKSRRNFLKNSAATAMYPFIATSGLPGLLQVAVKKKEKKDWPPREGTTTPKICMMCALDAKEDRIRMIKQLGVNYINISGVTAAWKEDEMRAGIEYLKKNGLIPLIRMHSVSSNIVLGRPGRDADIEVFQNSLKVAGASGLPTVEYNFYVDRLIEGYYEMEGRGGAVVTGYDYSRVKDIPAKPEIGVHKAGEIWTNLKYFLEAVIPVAEKAGVRMALHPNDPVAQVAHQSDQIMANLANWKRLITLVDSPSNGITFDPGVTREMGEDPAEVCRYFASRDRINHMHYRNVTVDIPYDKYVECFIDEGYGNLFEVMQEVFKNGYTRGILPEHPHLMDYDRDYAKKILGKDLTGGPAAGGGGGGYAGDVFNIAFTRGLMWSVMSL